MARRVPHRDRGAAVKAHGPDRRPGPDRFLVTTGMQHAQNSYYAIKKRLYDSLSAGRSLNRPTSIDPCRNPQAQYLK
jgi:hypothetical protein